MAGDHTTREITTIESSGLRIQEPTDFPAGADSQTGNSRRGFAFDYFYPSPGRCPGWYAPAHAHTAAPPHAPPPALAATQVPGKNSCKLVVLVSE